ncbi:MAG: DUF4129 domain-containing protein [Nocardiopsaceae bacterium]|jgi:hypothetical protein|nr:DUF4129 domain-containing protein [Nocardiopsaceae bacterium]
MSQFVIAIAARRALLPAGGPLIGRHAGQRIARRELAERSFWQSVADWFIHLPTNAQRVVPGGWFGLIALAILAVLAVTLVVFWARPASTRRSQAEPVLGGKSTSARDYRRSAEQLADAGDYAGAIVDRVRAIAAELDERAILPARPGRTADELASEAGRELPELASDLRTATRLFDDVRYGEKAGNLAGYQLVCRLDKAVRTARSSGAAAQEPEPAGFGVPR